MKNDELKIKLWYLFKVNKKQFLLIYLSFSLMVVLGGIWAYYYNPVIRNDASWLNRFYLKNDVVFWLVLILYTIIEALVFWNNFNKEHIKIINEQKAELVQQKEEIKAQSEEIATQRDDAINQKNKIELQQQQITASIQYAERIQQAVLPPKIELDDFFDNFILFHPRDIVSGDFYWFKTVKSNDKDLHIIVAADCTGHGVPGAFVSMLGIALLKEIIVANRNFRPEIILNELRSGVKKALHQKGQAFEQQDGMDIALAVIDRENMKLNFAGANNPLYLCRKTPEKLDFNDKKIRLFEAEKDLTLIEIRPDKMPIGIYTFEKDFTAKSIDLQKNDMIYMFSDGYIDQFGGEKGQKFMSKNFKKLLCKINNKSIEEQKQYLEQTLTNWIGNREQIDDILVMGIKL